MLSGLWGWAKNRPNLAMRVAGKLMFVLAIAAVITNSLANGWLSDHIKNRSSAEKGHIWDTMREYERFSGWVGTSWVVIAFGLISCAFIRKRLGFNDLPD